MPISSRGAQYYGNLHNLLHCKVDHDKLANSLYEKLIKEGGYEAKTNCDGCGSLIMVFKRQGGEWETRIFATKER